MQTHRSADGKDVSIVKKISLGIVILTAVMLIAAYRVPVSNFSGFWNLMRDKTTNAMKSISYEHYEIHGGSHFFVCGESTVASGDSLDFQLTTSNTTKWIHMTFEFEGTQETLMEIFETATVATDGSAVTAYNNDRNSAKTTTLSLLQAGGTVTAPGTLIYSQRVGVAGNPLRSKTGASKRDNEIILKQNVTYRFVFTSGGNGNNLSYCGEWYEHTNKN